MTSTRSTNRSLSPGAVIPEVPYSEPLVAAAWLCRAFGFRERLRIFAHRVQLLVGDGSLVIVELPAGVSARDCGHRLMIPVADVDAHAARAEREGARIVSAPADQPFGERQYTAEDFAGQRWTFTQTIADVDPASWGGEMIAETDSARPTDR